MSDPVGNSPRVNIPGNSHKEREESKAEAEPREPVQKIIEGKVVTRKQAWYKRATRSLVADDVQNIRGYLLSEIVVPTVRNFIRDIIVSSTDRALYGSARGRRDGPGFGLSGTVGGIRTKYDQISTGERRPMSRDAQRRHDFDEVVLEGHAEAVEVVEALIARVMRYGAASVADLYDLVGVTGSYADQKWGWTDLRTADVRPSRGGYLLDLPQPEPLR
jgi:hypothetical protein